MRKFTAPSLALAAVLTAAAFAGPALADRDRNRDRNWDGPRYSEHYRDRDRATAGITAISMDPA